MCALLPQHTPFQACLSSLGTVEICSLHVFIRKVIHWRKGEQSHVISNLIDRSSRRLRASALTERPNDFGPKIGGLPSSLVPHQHETPSKFLFSKDVEPPIAARRGGGCAATRRARIPLLTRCIALVELGVAAAAVCATSAAKCGMLHEHSRYDQSAQPGQNYRVSTVHFERQWSGRVP